MSRRKPQKIAKMLGNDQDIEFVDKRMQVFEREIQNFKANQLLLKDDSSVALLKLSAEENEQTDENDGEQKINRREDILQRARKIEQQINMIRSVASNVEKRLLLGTGALTNRPIEELEEARVKELQENEECYQNLEFNMNYQLDLEKNNPRDRSRNNFFTPLKKEHCLNKQLQLNSNYYEYNKELFKNVLDQVHQFQLSIPEFKTESDFSKFDDFIQTQAIDNSNKYESIVVDVAFDCNLSVLTLLRFLLTVKQCSIFILRPSHSRKESQLQNVQKTIEAIIEVLFSITNLQHVEIQQTHQFLPIMVSGLKRIENIEKLNLACFKFSGDLRLADTNIVSEFLEIISRLPKLIDFKTDAIVISDDLLHQRLNNILLRVKAAQFRLDHIPTNFSFKFAFENLERLVLYINCIPKQFSNKDLDNLLQSIQTASSLKTLILSFSQNVQIDTSRKNILNSAATKKAAEATPYEDLQLFERLSALNKLKTLKLTILTNQQVYNSFLSLLKQNENIQSSTYSCLHTEKTDQIDLMDFYETINGLRQIQFFQFSYCNTSVTYKLPNKQSTLYSLSINNNTTCLTQSKEYRFQSTVFSFDKVKNVQLEFVIDSLEKLDDILSSLGSCKSLDLIQLNITSGTSLTVSLCKTPSAFPQKRYFGHLIQLKQLQQLKIDIPVDLKVLSSIVEFILQSNNLKSFIFKRNLAHQYYLDYAQMIYALQSSKSIEEIYLNTNTKSIAKPSEANIHLWNNAIYEGLYKPIAGLLKNPPASLKIIDFDEEKTETSALNLIFEALNQSQKLFYTKFNTDSLKAYSLVQTNEDQLESFKTCVRDGRVCNPSHRLPLTLQGYRIYSWW